MFITFTIMSSYLFLQFSKNEEVLRKIYVLCFAPHVTIICISFQVAWRVKGRGKSSRES